MLKKLFTCIILIVLCAQFCSCSKVDQAASPTPTISPTEIPPSTPTPLPETGIIVNRQNFPDSTFRDYILDHFDKDYDEKLSSDEVKTIRTLDVSNKGIETVVGIEYLTSLTEIAVNGNALTTLDVSKNVELTQLDCSKNDIKALMLNENLNLIDLNCADNPNLKDLGIASIIGTLQKLNVSGTAIEKLSFNYMNSLNELQCTNSKIKSLAFSNDSSLQTLEAGGITEVNLSGCKYLSKVTLDYQGDSLDIVGLQYLRSIDITYGRFTERITILDCPYLEKITIDSENDLDSIRQISAKNLGRLKEVLIRCSQPATAEVDLSGCSSLQQLDVWTVKKVNLSGCSSLSSNRIWYDPYTTTLTGR